MPSSIFVYELERIFEPRHERQIDAVELREEPHQKRKRDVVIERGAAR